MRGLFLAAVLFGLAAPFVGAGGAHACTCMPSGPATQVRMAPIIIVATPTGNFDDRANARGPAFEVEVNQTIRGSIDDTILVTGLGNCSVDLFPNQQYLLLGELIEGELSTTKCAGSGPLGTAATSDIVGVIEATGTTIHGRQEEPEAEHKDVPWIPILVLAFVIPTAVLVIPSFFMGKRKAEDDDTGPRG